MTADHRFDNALPMAPREGPSTDAGQWMIEFIDGVFKGANRELLRNKVRDIEREAVSVAGHRWVDDPHDCLQCDCAGLGYEVSALNRRIVQLEQGHE